MELVSYRIPRSVDELLVMPVGDIQYTGARYDTADLDRLKRHLDWGVSKGAWFIGMGDYTDFASPSNRQRISAAGLYETAEDVLENVSADLVNKLYDKALKGTEGRWFGLLEGHHFYQGRDGVTSDQALCKLLKTTFLGSCACVRLVFSNGGSGSGTVTIWAHHGTGSGRIGSPLNKLELLPTYWDADIYLMGHQSKKVAAPLDRIYPTWTGKGQPHLMHRTIVIAGTGGFSKAYLQGHQQGNVPRGGYVEKGMMSPVALGGVVLKIRPRWKRINGGKFWAPDINVEL